MGKYNIGDTSFSKLMNEKIELYKSLTLRAEIINRDNDGKPTKQEAQRYAEASKVCEEIMNLNLSERATYEKWRRNQQDCEEKVREIVEVLAPAPKPQPKVEKRDDESEPQRNSQTNTKGAAGGKVSQTTESGFTTKNATKEIPAETIEKWHKAIPDHGLDQVVGMEEQKKLLEREAANLGWDMTDDTLSISPTQRYFFYGLPGCGKTYLIEAFAHDMKEKGFDFIQLVGGEIHQSLVGVGEKIVQAAFQEAIDNAPSVIFIDEIENVCTTRGAANAQGHERRLTVAFLEALNNMKNSGKRIVFLGATNYPRQVDAAMRDRAHMVSVPLPDEQARAKYFESAKKLGILPLEEGLSYEYMADMTDDFSYRDLDRICDAVKIEARERAIELHAIYGEDGKLDIRESDKAASEAIRQGEVVLTKEWFDQTRKKNPPSNKAEIREELLAFEREIANE